MHKTVLAAAAALAVSAVPSLAAGKEPLNRCAAQTFGAAADEYALAGELGRIGGDAHTVISSAVMASFSSVKR